MVFPRSTIIFLLLPLLPGCISGGNSSQDRNAPYVEVPVETIMDKIRGGVAGQMIGVLNGLQYEFKFIEEPGNITQYTPALPDGAYTDDDTDFEWVYICEMQRKRTIMLPYRDIAELWKTRINRNIWCSNNYARGLMDLDIFPPNTGNIALNPWAEFNISGQFLCETFGLLAPGMPQTAAKTGLHYTRVAIGYEPAQSTQLFTTMIATSFLENDMGKIIDAGYAALDSRSVQRQIITDVKKWHNEYPADWKTTRKLILEKYSHKSWIRTYNGYELNTAAVISSLLYGEGDFSNSVRMAFNFGWDADCNAATVGTIMGTIKGYRWIMSQGWTIVDRYKNTTRDNMPMDETITSFADRVIELFTIVNEANGGSERVIDNKAVYRIRTELPETNSGSRRYPVTGTNTGCDV